MSISSLTSASATIARQAPPGLLAVNAVRATEQVGAVSGSASAIRVGLSNMNVVLSLSTEAATRGVDQLDFTVPVASHEISDPVMRRLFGHLDRPGESDDGYADAIRIALAARWLKLRSGEQGQQPTEALQKWRLKKVLAYIDENLAESVSLADLARTAGLSRMYFAARFRAATGQRPHDYVLQRRIERAKEMLAQTEETLVNIALDIGFHTQAHFTTVFKKFVGSTPGRWRAINRFA
jgi:AraC-like DNA-binding protein